MVLLPVPMHRTRLAQEKEPPGGSPPPLPGIVSPGQNSIVHSRAMNLTGGTCLSGEAATLPRTGDLGGNQRGAEAHIHIEVLGACGVRMATELPRSPHSPQATRPGGSRALLRACTASFWFTVLSPRSTLGGLGAGREGQTLHSAGNQGSERVRLYTQGSTVSQHAFHTTLPAPSAWMPASEALPAPTDELSLPPPVAGAHGGPP